jgi:hypothetical protein
MDLHREGQCNEKTVLPKPSGIITVRFLDVDIEQLIVCIPCDDIN